MSYYDVVFYISIYLKVLLTAMMNKIVRCVAAKRIFVSVLYMQEDNNMNTLIRGIQLFACNLHTNFVLLRFRYYQQYGIEIVSDYLGLILDCDKL